MTGKTLKITQAKIHTKRTQIHNYERCSQSIPGQQRLFLEQPVWMEGFAVKRITEVSALRCPLCQIGFVTDRRWIRLHVGTSHQVKLVTERRRSQLHVARSSRTHTSRITETRLTLSSAAKKHSSQNDGDHTQRRPGFTTSRSCPQHNDKNSQIFLH